MALSASSFAPSPLPGLTLRAWALVSTGGALLKGFNVSAAIRNSVGSYSLTLTANMPDTNVTMSINAQGFGDYGPIGWSANATVGVINYLTSNGTGTRVDLGTHFIGVYG